MEKLVIIDGDYFYAAIVAKEGKVIDAAPILKYTIGWNAIQVLQYCNKKGFKIIK